MNTIRDFIAPLRKALITAGLSSTLLVSCGDPVTLAGIGGTGIIQGIITGFGSVFVNGVKFETDSSKFEVDGDLSATQADLAIGMVVTVRGSIDTNGTSGNAVSIEYDDNIQGPVGSTPAVSGSQKSFTIFGQNIIVDEVATSFDGTNFDSLKVNDVLEISGFPGQNGDVVASFVQKTGVLVPGKSEVELKGTVSVFSQANKRFNISGINITFDNQTEIDIPGGQISNGQFVEVEGIIQADGSIHADEIELEEENFGDSVESISLQGIISNYNNQSDFTLNGLAVDASSATLTPSNIVLSNGMNIEVEGSIEGGVLIVDQLELRQGSIELKAFVNDIVNNTIIFSFPPLSGTISIISDSQTQFEDDAGANPIEDFTLAHLNIGNFVKIKALDNNGSYIASRVKRIDVDTTEIQGPFDSFDAGLLKISLLGITYNLNALTDYESFADANAFFTHLSSNPGQVIKIDDDFPADGIADKAGVEN